MALVGFRVDSGLQRIPSVGARGAAGEGKKMYPFAAAAWWFVRRKMKIVFLTAISYAALC